MGLLDGLKRLRVGRRRAEPHRDTQPFPNLIQIGQQRPGQKVLWKPTPRNLRYFARTPYARRAINTVKNPISMLEWEIVPLKGVDLNPELERQIEVATRCLESPNHDDDFRTFTEQVVEDVLVGAGAIETQLSGDQERPLWMWPVDGLSIQVYPAWTGDANEARYTQSVGYGTYMGGGPTIQLRDDELIYIRPNPNTSTPFGLGPLEVAFNSISRQLGVGEFAGNLTTNARPGIMLDLGEGADKDALAAFRMYWRNEIEGQGVTPIVGTKGGKVHQLFPEGDTALYLKYQEFLKVEIAIAFDLSPQNLGVERDVNRNTAEVAEDRDFEQAIRPRAIEYAAYLTRHALHKRLGFWQLRLRFPGLDREDEAAIADIFETEYQSNAITPNEYREARGRPASTHWAADLTYADVQIATAAAAGVKQLIDPDLPKPTKLPEPKPAPAPKKGQP
jgi:hypothetical protein